MRDVERGTASADNQFTAHMFVNVFVVQCAFTVARTHFFAPQHFVCLAWLQSHLQICGKCWNKSLVLIPHCVKTGGSRRTHPRYTRARTRVRHRESMERT